MKTKSQTQESLEWMKLALSQVKRFFFYDRKVIELTAQVDLLNELVSKMEKR